VRVEKIVRHNEARLFAAASDGVYTSSDGGKSWTHLKGSNLKSLDIALGEFEGKPALLELNRDGLSVFDGVAWCAIAGAPEKARSLVVGLGVESGGLIFGTPLGARAGIVENGEWRALAASDPLARRVAYAGELDRALLTIHEATVAPFSGPKAWNALRLPVEQKLVSSIAADPFAQDRLYLATNGSGIFVFGSDDRAIAPSAQSGAR